MEAIALLKLLDLGTALVSQRFKTSNGRFLSIAASILDQLFNGCRLEFTQVDACGTQMPRRSCGLSCRLQLGHRPRRRGVTACAFSAGVLPTLQPVTSFALYFCFRVRRAASNWPVSYCPPARLAPHLRSRNLRGWWRRCSRRGRAALRPDGNSHPRPSAPKGLPFCLRVTPDDRFAATGPPLRLKVLFPCPRPGSRSLRSDCQVTGFFADGSATAETPRTLRSSAIILSSGPSADTRFAVTSAALRSFLIYCPLPERPRFARTHRVAGLVSGIGGILGDKSGGSGRGKNRPN